MEHLISKREKEVLELISLGFSTKEVAVKLFVSIETIKSHRSNLINKLNARNAVHLVRIASEYNLFKKHDTVNLIAVHSSGVVQLNEVA